MYNIYIKGVIILHDNLSKLLGVALIVIVVFKFILKDVPNFFYFDTEVKDTLVNISLSYIAAYIFYLLQVWVPEKRKEQEIHKAQSIHLNNTLKEMKVIIGSLYPNAIFDQCILFDKDDLEKKITGFNMKNPTRFSKGMDRGNEIFFNYIEMIYSADSRIKYCIQQCIKISSYNYDLNIILNRIENCVLFRHNTIILGVTNMATLTSHIDGGPYRHGISEFYELYWQIRTYMNEKNIEIID